MTTENIKTLGPIEGSLLKELVQNHLEVFTLKDARNILEDESIKKRLPNLLHRLHQKGWVRRISKGVYILLPLSADSQTPYTQNEWVIASRLLSPSYVGFRTILQHYGWTEQLPHPIFVASPKRKKNLVIQGVSYQFVTLSEKKFFGVEEISIDGLSIKVSEREKTILDCLDHLEYAGGITEVSKALWNAREELDWEKLLSYGIRMGDSAILKRLGYLTELLRIADAFFLEEVEKHLKKGYSLLDPSAGHRNGKRISRWRLILNIPPDEILSWREYPMEISKLIRTRREEILQLCVKRGARNIRIFGSAVRGESGPGSDIDFLVDLEEGRSLFDLGGLLMELQDLLGRKVDLVTEAGLHWYIRDRILQEAIPL